MSIEIRQAQNSDAAQVAAILREAALWLDSIQQSLWQCNELAEEIVFEDVHAGRYYMAWMDGEAVGVMLLQFEDQMFWPDIPPGDSAFLHRFAVKRKVAGMGISTQMLNWAKEWTRQQGLKFLRLDCVTRPKLCALYERNGFIKHSNRQAGPYYVARYEYNTQNAVSSEQVVVMR